MICSDPSKSPCPGGPIRLNSLKGYGNRTNNIIYCTPLLKSSKDEIPSVVVYFGGDVQDVPENMEGNRDTKIYVKFNLENTAILLREAFPKAHVIVVQPARMEYTTFSCFDNFVRGNCAGIPDHTPMHYALQHLEELLTNITKKLKNMSESELISKLNAKSASISVSNAQAGHAQGNLQSNNSTEYGQDMDVDILQVQETVVSAESEDQFHTNNVSLSPNTHNSTNIVQSSSVLHNASLSNSEILWWRESLNLDKASIALVGFSKGCVVLNQFIYEFHYLKTLTPDDSTMMRLVSRIKDMFWLDGGHGGGKNTWITSRSLLETLCRLGINIHIHVTPYQVQDDHRPWIRKEEKSFADLLKKLGANLTRHLHASDTNGTNLFTHFEVLHGFKKYQLQLFAQQFAHQQAQLQQLQQQQQQTIQSTAGVGNCGSATATTTPMEQQREPNLEEEDRNDVDK